MSSPRVLVVGNFVSSYGLSTGVCEELAARLGDSGWTALTTSSRLCRPILLADMLSTVWRRRYEYDLAHVSVYSGAAFLWAEAVCQLLRALGRPYVLTLHGGALPEFARRAKRRVRHLLSFAAAVTVPSLYLRSQMAEYRHDLILLPNAVDVSNYCYRIRRSLQPRLIWLRAFHEIYNPTMAPRVLARLKDEFPSISLKMLGPDKGDSSRQRTVEEARSRGVSAHLEVQDSIPKMLVPQLLDTGDIFLNTSCIDNTPVSVLEAMASGLCIVSTDAGGIPYLLQSGKNALLVPLDDDREMAAAVRRLLTDHALSEQIQHASRATVCAFDWSVILPQWQVLLTSVAERHACMRRSRGAQLLPPAVL